MITKNEYFGTEAHGTRVSSSTLLGARGSYSPHTLNITTLQQYKDTDGYYDFEYENDLIHGNIDEIFCYEYKNWRDISTTLFWCGGPHLGDMCLLWAGYNDVIAMAARVFNFEDTVATIGTGIKTRIAIASNTATNDTMNAFMGEMNGLMDG